MKNEIRLILKEGQPEYAVVPYDTYLQLVDDAEMLEDIRDFDEAMKRIAEGEELVPGEITFAIFDGANPIKVWREYRGMTQPELAKQAGISAAYLSQIESGKRSGSTNVLKAIAEALNLMLDDIVR